MVLGPVTIYPARRVITMNPANPFASAIAVSDGRIVGVGDVDELAGWGDHVIDHRYREGVLIPGFVEAHAHVMTGGLERLTFVGRFDRRRSDGTIAAGCGSIDEVIVRLSEACEAMAPGDEPLVAYGLDPIYFAGDRLTATHLDRASTKRPIFVLHASGHLASVNTAMLAVAGITADTSTQGVVKGPDGRPNGELQEPPAMSLVPVFRSALATVSDADALARFAAAARQAGITTITDLATGGLADERRVAMWHEVIDAPDFPARIVPFATFGATRPDSIDGFTALIRDLKSRRSDKLFWGGIKLLLDGSIQGWTAQVSWPGYRTRSHDGWWGISPEALADIVHDIHRAGLQIHAHCNGDLTSELFIDAVETALTRSPRWDHRHTVTHGQLTTQAQYRRIKALGMGINLFSNHLFHWGDQHRDLTVGPERARGMNAAATAKRLGVPFTLHSDSPVTPLGGLHLMWSAVNRVTSSGEVLGEHERIDVASALEAVTLGGAYLLKLDHLIGSLEAGKFADFTVLDEDPYEVEPMSIRDIGIIDTVLGGHPRP
jgi:predicted amidohydrolase YtcJ